MKIPVKAKPGAREDLVEVMEDGSLTVWVKAVPAEGKANEAIRKLLAAYFKVPKMHVVIVSGVHARSKVVEVLK